MGVNKFLLYDRNEALKNFLEKIALPYISFRYNSTYELVVCDDYKSMSKNLERVDTRVDYCCFHMQDESELEIYTRLKKNYVGLPILLWAYSNINQNLYFRPGLIPEELILSDQKDYTKIEEQSDIEETLFNIKEYLDNYQPDEIEDNHKSIQSKPQKNQICFINGEEIISVESDNSSGKSFQWIKTTRGNYPCKLSISDIEKIYSTILFRCSRNALINKRLITGYNETNREIVLNGGEIEYPIKASREKFKQVINAYKLFYKDRL